MKKRCTRCGLTSPASHFYKRAKSPDGLQAYCKRCSLRSVKEYQGRIGKSIVHRSVKYGLRVHDVKTLMRVPCCQSCGAQFTSTFERKFDHCHTHGHFRGVLCHPCNMACQGTSEAAVSRLQKCVRYLQRDMKREQARAS